MSDAQFPHDPPKKSNSTLKIILIILIGGGICVALCCGAVMIGGGYLGMQVMGQMGEVVKAEVADDAVIQEKLGGADTVTINFQATQAYQQEGHPNAVVFDIQGPRDSGKLMLNPQEGEMILRTSEGDFPLATKLDPQQMDQQMQDQMQKQFGGGNEN